MLLGRGHDLQSRVLPSFRGMGTEEGVSESRVRTSMSDIVSLSVLRNEEQ